jgi:hypothetical protein
MGSGLLDFLEVKDGYDVNVRAKAVVNTILAIANNLQPGEPREFARAALCLRVGVGDLDYLGEEYNQKAAEYREEVAEWCKSTAPTLKLRLERAQRFWLEVHPGKVPPDNLYNAARKQWYRHGRDPIIERLKVKFDAFRDDSEVWRSAVSEVVLKSNDNADESPTCSPDAEIISFSVDARKSKFRSGRIYCDQPYVRRETYYEEFRTLVAAGERIIVFTGSSGMGKSRLARELVLERCLDDAKVAFLEADTEANLQLSLSSEAERLGINARENLSAAMAAACCIPDGLEYVVLDNVGELVSISALIPPVPTATFVITSTVDVRPAGRGSVIKVSNLGIEDAEELIRCWLPTVSVEEVSGLQDLLAGHPTGINSACSFIKLSGVDSPRDFCKRANADARELDVPVPPGQHTLYGAYAQIIGRLRVLNRPAVELLGLLAFLGPHVAPVELLRGSFYELSTMDGMSSDTWSFEKAVRFLQIRCLIDIVEQGVVIHPLIQRVVRSLLLGREFDLCRVLHVSIKSHVQVEFVASQFWTTEEIMWVLHLREVLRGILKKEDKQTLVSERVFVSLSAYLRALQQLGIGFDSIDFFRPIEVDDLPRKWWEERSAFSWTVLGFGDIWFFKGSISAEFYADIQGKLIFKEDLLWRREGENKDARFFEILLMRTRRALVQLDLRAVVSCYEEYRECVLKAKGVGVNSRILFLSNCVDAFALLCNWAGVEKAFADVLTVFDGALVCNDSVEACKMWALGSYLSSRLPHFGHHLNVDTFSRGLDEARSWIRRRARIPCVPVEARLRHADVNCAALGAVYARLIGYSPLEADYGAIFREYHDVLGLFSSFGDMRSLFRATCDLVHFSLFADSMLKTGNFDGDGDRTFHQLAKRALGYGDLQLAVRCQLSVVKNRLINRKARMRDVGYCLRLAGRISAAGGWRVRYVDALLTAYAVSVECSMPRRYRDSLRIAALRAGETHGVFMTPSVMSLIEAKDPLGYYPQILLSL